MTRRESRTHGQPIFLSHLSCILYTEVNLIAVYLCRIGTSQSIIVGITISIASILIVITPNITYIGTNREALHWHPTSTDIYLMKSTLTIISIGIGSTIEVRTYLTRTGIIISHIGKRKDTEADTDVFGNSQTSYHILEVSILGILLHTILIEVGNLSGDTSIKNKRQRIYIGIGSRVQIVDLVVLMKTKTHAIHTTIETRSLVRQHAKTILAVWRISTTLGIYHKSRTQQKGC
ncbi:unknown [Prevotella sp. CAG:732]|nr:unknown [Prevotella sp. CAG:732]